MGQNRVKHLTIAAGCDWTAGRQIRPYLIWIERISYLFAKPEVLIGDLVMWGKARHWARWISGTYPLSASADGDNNGEIEQLLAYIL